jgi:hypothetical protein
MEFVARQLAEDFLALLIWVRALFAVRFLAPALTDFFQRSAVAV